jgi:hypothetical protein
MSPKPCGQARLGVLRLGLTSRAIALELRRQERGSDFTGYTENYTFMELVEFVRDVGGKRWQLSCVPLSRLRCWNTRTPLVRLLKLIGNEQLGEFRPQKIRRLVSAIQRQQRLPGIVVTWAPHKPGEHWILSGHRRLAAHRIARAAKICVYHPADLFPGCATPPDRRFDPPRRSTAAPRRQMSGLPRGVMS